LPGVSVVSGAVASVDEAIGVEEVELLDVIGGSDPLVSVLLGVLLLPTMPPTTAAMTIAMATMTRMMIPLGVRQNGLFAAEVYTPPDSANANFSFEMFSGMAGVTVGIGGGTSEDGTPGVAGLRTDCERCGWSSSRSTS